MTHVGLPEIGAKNGNDLMAPVSGAFVMGLKGAGVARGKNTRFWPFLAKPLPLNGTVVRNRNEIENSKTKLITHGWYAHISAELDIGSYKDL